MNILGDFISRVNNLYGGADNEEIDGLITMIKNQQDEITAKDKEIERLRKKLEKYNPTELEEKPVKKAAAKKSAKKVADVKLEETPKPKKTRAKKAVPKAE